MTSTLDRPDVLTGDALFAALPVWDGDNDHDPGIAGTMAARPTLGATLKACPGRVTAELSTREAAERAAAVVTIRGRFALSPSGEKVWAFTWTTRTVKRAKIRGWACSRILDPSAVYALRLK